MMAQVDPILQVVNSRQVIALHSSTVGDIVDSEPRVGSRQIKKNFNKSLNMFPESVDLI